MAVPHSVDTVELEVIGSTSSMFPSPEQLERLMMSDRGGYKEDEAGTSDLVSWKVGEIVLLTP